MKNSFFCAVDICEGPGYISACILKEHYNIYGSANEKYDVSIKGFYHN